MRTKENGTDAVTAMVVEALEGGSLERGACRGGCGRGRVWIYDVNGIRACWSCWRNALGDAAPKTAAEPGNTVWERKCEKARKAVAA